MQKLDMMWRVWTVVKMSTKCRPFCSGLDVLISVHDDVINWKDFPRYWPFVRGIHRSPVNSPHKCQWRGALMFSVICVWINDWVNNRCAGDLRRHCAHYDVIVMFSLSQPRIKTNDIAQHHQGTVANKLHKCCPFYLNGQHLCNLFATVP